MILLTVLAIILLSITVIVTIPFSYTLTINIRDPFRLSGLFQWGNSLLCCTWAYTYGQKPQTSLTCLGKTVSPPSKNDSTLSNEQIDAAVKSIEEEATVTYNEVKEAQHAASHTAATHAVQSWKHLIINTDFLCIFFIYLQRILIHSRIRTLRISGSIGLPQPHETGMFAGALYACIPAGIDDLYFNFTKEEYNCIVQLKGCAYPIVLAIYTISFVISRPVRKILAYWRTQKRGEQHHG